MHIEVFSNCILIPEEGFCDWSRRRVDFFLTIIILKFKNRRSNHQPDTDKSCHRKQNNDVQYNSMFVENVSVLHSLVSGWGNNFPSKYRQPEFGWGNICRVFVSRFRFNTLAEETKFTQVLSRIVGRLNLARVVGWPATILLTF